MFSRKVIIVVKGFFDVKVDKVLEGVVKLLLESEVGGFVMVVEDVE